MSRPQSYALRVGQASVRAPAHLDQRQKEEGRRQKRLFAFIVHPSALHVPQPPLLVAILALALAAMLTPHASPAADQDAKSLEYRRYFVPSDRPQDWPKHNVLYLPISREEFDELVRAANGRPRLAEGESPIVRARYTARLEEPDLLVGEAELEITHNDEKSALITLDPFGMSLDGAHWADDSEATIGALGDGKLAVVVERSGKLLCTWSSRGHRDSTGSLVLVLEFPSATVCELELDLDESLTPTIAQAVETSDSEEHRTGKWRFQLGGRSRAALRLDPAEGRARSRRLALLQEKTVYSLLPGSIDLAVQLKLDVYREPLRRLEVELDAPLRIVSVQYGGAEVPWSLIDEGRPVGSPISIEFREPLFGPARVVMVSAVAPLDLDVPVKLPRLRVRDVAWQEGDMTLLVPGPLALDALLPQGCRQTKVAPLSVGPSGESIELQSFSPEAAVAVQVSRRRSRAKLSSGTTLRIAPDLLRAEFRGRVEAVEGELFVLQAAVAPGWEIDSLTADRAEALANWSVDRSVRPAVMLVQFAESVTPTRPAQLMVTGHRRATAEARYASESLDFLRFRDVSDEVRLLALETSSSQHLTLHGVDRPSRKQRILLSTSERSLLPSALSDVIFEIDADRPDWNVVIEQQAPRYSVDIHGTIAVGQRNGHESYRIRCQPGGSRVDRLLLWFSQPRSETLSLSGDDAIGLISAERISPDDNSAHGLPRTGETWLVHLARPATEPFEILASRSLPLAEAFIPALVAAPDAESQQGIVEVMSMGSSLAIESAERLEPVPRKPSANDGATATAAFRYDPAAEMVDTSSAALRLRDSAGAMEPAKASVWRLRLYSHYRASGESYHAAEFEIENHGAAECVLNLPPGAEFLKAAVDGVAVVGRVARPELKLTLPAKRFFPVVLVEFLLRERPMGIFRQCDAPWPATNLPINERSWMLSSAGHYEPLTLSQTAGPWAGRLLGSLGRQAGAPAFNPMRVSDWRNLVPGSHAKEPSTERAMKLVEVLGQIIAADRAGVNKLGQWFAAGRRKDPALFAAVYVDRHSLAAFGIDTGSAIEVPLAPGDLAPAQAAVLAAECLRSLGLALLIEGEQMVVTTRAAARELAQQDLPADDAFLVRRRSSSEISARPPTLIASYLPLSTWLQTPVTAWDAEWRKGACRVLEAMSRAYRIEPGRSGAWRVFLIHHDVVVAAGWALGALVFSLGAALRRGRMVWLALDLFFALTVALWAPPALLPLSRGLFLGALSWAAWMYVRPQGRAVPSAQGRESVAARAGVVGPLFLLLSACTGAAIGDEPMPASETRERPPVYRVFVPTDAENKPGTRYHVPTDFLDELRRRANLANSTPRGWLITAANYECTLSRENVDAPLTAGRLAVHCQLDVLSANVRVRLPFARRQADLVPDSADLDGEPIDLTWSAAGDELICDIFEPGAYELAFQLIPMLGDDVPANGLSLSIPKVAAATVDVWLPAEDVGVEVPNALGARTLLEGGRKLSARLGPVDTLKLHWPEQAAVAPVAEVEELLWLKVRPGSVVLDVMLKLNVTSGALRQLEFAADRRLRLVPGAVKAKERAMPGQPEISDAPQTTLLDLDQPVTGPASLRFSFFFSGASGVGNLRLPEFHTLHARSTRRWLAVTVDSGLEYETLGAEQLDALAAADFANEWGDADALRDALAYRLNSAETAWSLATRSREPQTTVKETLSLSFQSAHAVVRYEAQLMTSAGFVFQHRLLVPPEIMIERIALEEDGVDRVSYWARSAPGMVSIFLNRRLTGAQQLILNGRLPVRANGRVSLPLITMEPGLAPVTIERAEVLSRTVYFYRQPTVRIALEESAGLSPLSDVPLEAVRGRLGRLVLSRRAGGDYSGTVVVSPNDCKIRDVKQVTSLRYTNQQWIAEASWRFTVDGGVLDTLRFELPTAWAAGAEVVSPPSSVELAERPGNDGGELTVQPLAPLTGDCEIKLRAALKFAPGDPVIAPDIEAFDLPPGERYWLLPRQVGIESVSWDVQRLSPDELPDAVGGVPSDAWFVFRAMGDRPQAVMSAVKASVDASRIRLADVRLARRGNRVTAAIAFDLEPGGRAACPLELAAGWQLLGVTVGGAVVTPLSKGPGKWDVPLASNRLPQRLETTLSSESAAGDLDLVRLPLAWCENWPVEETLLTIHAADDDRVEVEATPSNRETCDAARLSSILDLADLPLETIATTPADDLAAWYTSWAQWFAFLNRQAVPTNTATSAGETAGAHVLPREKWLQIAKKLHVEKFISQPAQEPPLATQLMEIWQQMHDGPPASYYRWTGPQAPVQVRLARDWRGWPKRLMQTSAIGALLLAVVFLLRRIGLSDLMIRWPHVVAAAIGLLWWLFCQPSAAGWLLIGWSVVVALRSISRPIAT